MPLVAEQSVECIPGEKELKNRTIRVQQAFGRMALSEPIRCFHQNILNV